MIRIDNSLTKIIADSLYVPYVGATSAVNLGAQNFLTTGTLGAGAITGTSLIKSGGTSSQFLKADGSVDTSTYLTDIVNDTTPQLGGDLDGQSLYDLNNIVDAEFEGTIGVGTTPGTTAIISAIKSMNGIVAFGVSGSITGTRSNGDMTFLRGLSYIATYTPDNLVSTARKVTSLDGAFATATIASKDGETVNISAFSVQGYRSALSAIVGSGASGTVNVVSGSHYRAPDATVGNGGTFTTLRAFYDLGQTVATTNWGFYGLTANNYLSGGLQIGGTAAVGQTAGYLYFRDSAINIASIDDGHLDLTADVSIDLNGLTLSQNIVPITDDTYYLGEIGSPFKAYKALILKDTTNGSHYSITIVNGVITTIALD